VKGIFMIEFFEIGQITNTHGLKGELKVRSFSGDKERFEKLIKILIDVKNTFKEYEIESVRYQKDFILLKLKGIDDIDSAEKLKNCYIKMPRDKAENLSDDEFYIVDLIGSEVYDRKFIGILDDIFSAGGSDVYVIKREMKKDLLLPAIESVIKKIDIKGRKIFVEIPRGIDDEV
jgi:16S rRNA processing protein RimM